MLQIASEAVGYLPRGKKRAALDNLEENYIEARIQKMFPGLAVTKDSLADLTAYYNYRTGVVRNAVSSLLRTRDEAIAEYNRIKQQYPHSTLKTQVNKQGGKEPLWFVNSINLLTESVVGRDFDDDPIELAYVTNECQVVHTFSRRMDGVYPHVENPVAIWEVKENYTTSGHFGSRISDAIYLERLDGYEIEAAYEASGWRVLSYVLIDGKIQWSKGKSFICRLVDLLNMGVLDEVLIGKEVLTEWPKIVATWKGTKTRAGVRRKALPGNIPQDPH